MTEEELRRTHIAKAEIINMELYINDKKFVGDAAKAMEIIRLRMPVALGGKVNEVSEIESVSNKVFLIDIDGTVCDDIKNEESHLYATAAVLPGALEILNKWYDEGNVITFFTARESKDREVTEKWLNDNGFKYHGLVMDKPRIKDEQEYVWIDNRKVRAVTYLGTWGELKEVDAKIQTFG